MKPGLVSASLLAILLPALGASNHSTTNSTESRGSEHQQPPQGVTTGWQAEPNGRGTFSLIFSCVLTLTLCVWSALHLNVPPLYRPLRWRFIEQAKWVLYGVFAPEVVVATAAAQFIVASWLKREIQADAKARQEDGDAESKSRGQSTHTWDMTQCFYAAMGGFAANVPGVEKTVTVTPEGIRLLSFLGRLPQIDQPQIEDKSKADWMAKSIICIQAGWMVIQVLGRAIKHYPISLLEINTCGHVACALVIYLLWWNKPLDVQVPTFLNDEDDKDLLCLMHLCSSMSSVDGITDIRCFIHVANDDDERLCKPPTDRESVAGEGTEATRSQLTTYLSIGSPGTRNPSHFLGFPEVWLGPDPGQGTENPHAAAKNKAFRYNFDLNSPPISASCSTYNTPPYTGMSLRHSRYCRRVFPDASKSTSTPGSLNPSTTAEQQPGPNQPRLSTSTLQAASRATDRLRAACTSRPAYKAYYFTFVSQLGHFLGETDYVVSPRLPNLPSLHNLSLGQVNLHRDRLRSVLALAAAGYGALHVVTTTVPSNSEANHEALFPTGLERVLWLVSAGVIGVSGIVLWGFFAARYLSSVLIK
ncbi:hypothetical protein N656DRAFT_769310 [Canariomyces notabilis]|uniref:Uncharacterized protein n=1 Tax=Canariomyces notabilis TaxID=2074819 RepID=A0AAN6TC89_9PEZI|nr:hypothetical protein N656DRAFT_769310 [Canariomyces arenarius]